MTRTASVTRVGFAGALVVGVAACGGDSGSDAGTVTVLAASSLTESVTELKQQVEKEHPGTTVQVSFAASSTLVQQVSQGAPADVVVLADERSAARLPADDRARPHQVVATNRLEIAVPPKNPGQVRSVQDLRRQDLDVVLCAPEVPCGRAAATMLAAVKVNPHVISREPNVKATLTKVRLGEADAGVVYRTDVRAAGADVLGVAVPDTQNVITRLPAYRLRDSAAARTFMTALTGEPGRDVLARHGFGRP